MGLRNFSIAALAALLGLAALPASAQITTIDPNTGIDSDLQSPPPARSEPSYAPAQHEDDPARAPSDPTPYRPAPGAPPAAPGEVTREQATNTFQREEVVGAAEDLFGKGASGLAGLIENVLKDQGQPNAYIAGSEAAGAIGVGLRYGSGLLTHKVEGQRKVYWTGPSIGFDLGGDATKVFVLVYNLYDSQELYKRFPAGEGRAYFVGGFSASYMRSGDVVLIPVRLGVGWRLGVNAGYMKFTEKRKWMPF